LVPIFIAKYQFGPSIFFISIWSLFWEIWCNQVLFVSGVVTVLNGMPRVSFWIFWIFYFSFWIFFFAFFYYFIIFLKRFKKLKKSSRVKLTLCHVVVIVSRVTIMPRIISLFSIWSQYFNFCLNLVPIFVKILQFCLSPNLNQI